MKDPTPDLIAALEAVVAEAKKTQHRLAEREAVNGSAGLSRIRVIASDAIAAASDREASAA